METQAVQESGTTSLLELETQNFEKTVNIEKTMNIEKTLSKPENVTYNHTKGSQTMEIDDTLQNAR